jgi:hypothetical protein
MILDFQTCNFADFHILFAKPLFYCLNLVHFLYVNEFEFTRFADFL